MGSSARKCRRAAGHACNLPGIPAQDPSSKTWASLCPLRIPPMCMQDLAAEVRERLEGTSLYLVGMMGRWAPIAEHWHNTLCSPGTCRTHAGMQCQWCVHALPLRTAPASDASCSRQPERA